MFDAPIVNGGQVSKLLSVADREMVTRANRDALETAGIDWIIALKAPQIKALADKGVVDVEDVVSLRRSERAHVEQIRIATDPGCESQRSASARGRLP